MPRNRPCNFQHTNLAYAATRDTTGKWLLKRIENLFKGSEYDQIERKMENEKSRREDRLVSASLESCFGV